MENGGNLYIESVDLGANHNGTTFFDYLGLQYIGDGGEQEVTTLKGGVDVFSSDLKFFYLGGYSPHYSIDRFEADGSEMLFKSEDGFGRMFLYETDSYKSVSSSVIMGAVATGDSLNLKAYLVSEMINYFLGYNPVTSLRENIASILNTSNYPNPFSSKTTIQYTVNATSQVDVYVYNTNGQVVRHLVSEEKLPGEYAIVWDATNNAGNLVKEGFYFYTITLNGHTHSEKMLLLR